VLPVLSGVSPDAVVRQVTAPAGFSVQLVASNLPPRLDLTFSSARVEVGPQSLVLLGPRPEWVGRLVSPALAHEAGLGAIAASVSADRLIALTELVVSLCPLASAVIQPFANHMACPAADFARDAESYLASGNPTPLWAYPRLVRDHRASCLETTGMGVFGLPDLAFPVEPSQAQELEPVAHALMRAMVDGGPLPVGAAVRSSFGEVTVEAVIHGALWCVPAGALAPEEVERARGQMGRRRALSALLGPHTQLHFPRSETLVAKEHFVMEGQSIAMTNGASEFGQPGGAPEHRNQHLELVLRARKLGPWANGWLDWAAAALHAHPAQRPLHEFDRVVLATPQAGIAGVLLWPFGHLLPESARPPVHLWILLPLTPEEVELFRRDPQSQRQWIQEREARRDVELVEQRWDTAADGGRP
jgi:hypothetical protein